MRTTTNYALNIAEGSDKYNHLTIDNPNYEKIDEVMKANQDSAVQTATELKSGSVHAITRNNPDSNMFRFVATSDYTAGETFTVDGVQVTALLPNGATLGTGAYHINANVLCCLVGTNMTVYTVGAAENIDASTLDGHTADYFATATALESVNNSAQAAGILANNASTVANTASEKVNSVGKVIYDSTYHTSVDNAGNANFTEQLNEGDVVLVSGYATNSTGTPIPNTIAVVVPYNGLLTVNWSNSNQFRTINVSTTGITWTAVNSGNMNVKSVIKLNA